MRGLFCCRHTNLPPLSEGKESRAVPLNTSSLACGGGLRRREWGLSWRTCAALLVAMLSSTQLAHAASEPAFPSKPLRLVTSEIGGSADVAARLVALGL